MCQGFWQVLAGGGLSYCAVARAGNALYLLLLRISGRRGKT